VLAEGVAAEGPAAEELEHHAETELTKLRAALSMEPGPEWLDADKNQRAASTVGAGGQGALSPSVILTFRWGAGQALVTGAPVQFGFVRGGGTLTAQVNTNDWGQANCILAGLEDPGVESVVRASLVYRVRGFAYAFEGVSRDFVYAPPARKAAILALERAGERVVENPLILDAVFNRLKGLDFDFSQYDGQLLGEEFQAVFGGEPQAVRRLALAKEVSYLVVALNDAHQLSQVELEGRKYNIWKSRVTATTRLVRVAAGKVLYSATVQDAGGQGGSAEKAALDGLRNAASAMGERIAGDLQEIRRLLAGGQ